MNKQYKQIGDEVWKNRVEKIVNVSGNKFFFLYFIKSYINTNKI